MRNFFLHLEIAANDKESTSKYFQLIPDKRATTTTTTLPPEITDTTSSKPERSSSFTADDLIKILSMVRKEKNESEENVSKSTVNEGDKIIVETHSVGDLARGNGDTIDNVS